MFKAVRVRLALDAEPIFWGQMPVLIQGRCLQLMGNGSVGPLTLLDEKELEIRRTKAEEPQRGRGR